MVQSTRGDEAMKKFVSILFVCVLMFSLSACSESVVKGSVNNQSVSGDAEFDIMPQKLLEKINVGDSVVVSVGDFTEEMPFVDAIIKEDGKLQLLLDRDEWKISVCIYNQSFCEKYDVEVSAKVRIEKA